MATYAAIEAGLGREGLHDLLSILNVPPPVSASNYASQVSKLLSISESVAKEHMVDAAHRLRERIIENSERTLQEDSIIDVAVTFDGTWFKRGFTANHGIGVVISADTGEVLDIVVLSKICELCKKNKSHNTKEDFQIWKATHLADGSCQQNYEGSSPNMETEAAFRLWSRSIDNYKLRYKWMISDGDSKAHNRVAEIYGNSEDERVQKLDCIGHVGKRMSRALVSIKNATKGKLTDGKSVGGKKGRLTEPVISRLSDLYRNAIRQNVDTNAKTTEQKKEGIRKLQKSIMVVLYHSIKLSNPNINQFCPTHSWCQ